MPNEAPIEKLITTSGRTAWNNIYEDLDEYEDLIEVDNKQNSNSVV